MGERAWTYLFGERSLRVYQIIYVCFVFIGSVVNLKSVLDFGDIMILAMAFPSLLGCFLMSGKVSAALEDYMKRLQVGQLSDRNTFNICFLQMLMLVLFIYGRIAQLVRALR